MTNMALTKTGTYIATWAPISTSNPDQVSKTRTGIHLGLARAIKATVHSSSVHTSAPKIITGTGKNSADVYYKFNTWIFSNKPQRPNSAPFRAVTIIDKYTNASDTS